MSNSASLFLVHCFIHIFTEPKIGFKAASYNVGEGEGYLVVKVELKGGVITELPIAFNIIVTDGEAHSEFL